MERLERIKMLIENEPLEILRPLALRMTSEIDRLNAVIKEIEKENALRSQAHLNLEEEVKVLRREIYGRSSEKRPKENSDDRKRTPEDVRLFSEAAFPAPEVPKSQKEKWKQVPEETITHGLSAEELKRESESRELENPSSDQWAEIPGAVDKVTTIQVIERRYLKETHLKKKYRLKDEFNPDKHNKDVIITAAGPAALLLGMNYSTDFVASIVSDKYISHMPLDRQTREMASLGLPGVRTSTLSRLCALSAASFEEMAERIKSELFREAETIALHLDETPWKIQHKTEKDGYMWVISSRRGAYYFFKPTRSGEVMRLALQGYTGAVLTDGYTGYNILTEAGIVQAFCWVHGRRKFLPIEKDDPEVKLILDAIDQLFKIEREATTFEELKLFRHERSRAIVDEIKARLISQYPQSRPKSQKRKAIEYLTSRWVGFTRFLDDIRVPLSNNEAERTIRPATVGRKNYYGSASHTGGDTAATHFTIIESCKKNEIDPRDFILMSLKKLAAGETVMTPLEYARHLRVPQSVSVA